VLITDDFCMGPVWSAPGGFRGALVDALNAGVDLILIAVDPAQVYPALAALMEAEQEGRLDGEMLERSARRLARAGRRLHPRSAQASGRASPARASIQPVTLLNASSATAATTPTTAK
jgi:beta-N-acetylhexosaminidase